MLLYCCSHAALLRGGVQLLYGRCSLAKRVSLPMFWACPQETGIVSENQPIVCHARFLKGGEVRWRLVVSDDCLWHRAKAEVLSLTQVSPDCVCVCHISYTYHLWPFLSVVTVTEVTLLCDPYSVRKKVSESCLLSQHKANWVSFLQQ